MDRNDLEPKVVVFDPVELRPEHSEPGERARLNQDPQSESKSLEIQTQMLHQRRQESDQLPTSVVVNSPHKS